MYTKGHISENNNNLLYFCVFLCVIHHDRVRKQYQQTCSVGSLVSRTTTTPRTCNRIKPVSRSTAALGPVAGGGTTRAVRTRTTRLGRTRCHTDTSVRTSVSDFTLSLSTQITSIYLYCNKYRATVHCERPRWDEQRGNCTLTHPWTSSPWTPCMPEERYDLSSIAASNVRIMARRWIMSWTLHVVDKE